MGGSERVWLRDFHVRGIQTVRESEGEAETSLHRDIQRLIILTCSTYAYFSLEAVVKERVNKGDSLKGRTHSTAICTCATSPPDKVECSVQCVGGFRVLINFTNNFRR